MALWGNKDSKTASGTIAIANTGIVTGTSTAFTTQAKIGNYIRAGGVDHQIVKITSNTVCQVESGVNSGAIVTVNAGATYTLSEKPTFVAASEATSTNGISGDSNKVFGIDKVEQSAGGDNVTDVSIANAGTGYLEVPAVVFSGGGGSGAAATATIAGGKVTAITVTNTGSSYETLPTVSIAVPRITIPTSGVNTSTEVITYAGHGLSAGEAVKYYNGGGTTLAGLTTATTYYAGFIGTDTFRLYDTKAHGTTAVASIGMNTTNVNITTNTFTATAHGLVNGAMLNYGNGGGASITGLVDTTDYYVVNKTTDTFQLAATAGGAAIDISGTGNNAQTFTSTGRLNLTGTGNNAQYFDKLDKTTATATAVKGSGGAAGDSQYQHITHAGWVRKTVGSGGRAGRVQYETLVAMGSITGDQADDIAAPDA
jgi:hypothetical protein